MAIPAHSEKCQNGSSKHCMKFEMPSFDALRKCHFVIFTKKCPKLDQVLFQVDKFDKFDYFKK
jgi:hypothetical protein